MHLYENILPDLHNLGAKTTLAAITTSTIADADLGMKPDPLAQEVAERFIRAAIAYRMKQAAEAEAATASRQPTIEFAAAELDISVETAAGIVQELVRLIPRPSIRLRRRIDESRRS